MNPKPSISGVKDKGRNQLYAKPPTASPSDVLLDQMAIRMTPVRVPIKADANNFS